MTAPVYTVLNIKTGIEHTVPEGHFALTDPTYKLIVPDEEKPKAPSVPKAPKPKRRTKPKVDGKD